MSGLSEVPDDLKIAPQILAAWGRIHEDVRQGRYYPSRVAEIELTITRHQTDVQSGELAPEIDWQSDLDTAQLNHNLQKDYLTMMLARNQRFAEQWARSGEEAKNLALRLTEGIIKFLLVMHGAVGLAAFAALANSKPADPVWTAAMIAIFGACAGLLLAAIGVVILITVLPKLSRQLLSTSSTDAQLKWRAVARYYDTKIRPIVNRAEHFAYGSFVVFIIYAAFALVALLP